MIFNTHNTAMARAYESRIAQFVIKNLITEDITSILDYGCGAGRDCIAYSEAGLISDGWDPSFNTRAPVGSWDIVSLTYVLNVIPSQVERLHTLKAAFNRVAPGGLLVVATRTEGNLRKLAAKNNWMPSGDGYITSQSRKTFQKGYNNNELKTLLIKHLDLIDLKTVINVSDALCIVVRKA